MIPEPLIEIGTAGDAIAAHHLFEQAQAWIRSRGIHQ